MSTTLSALERLPRELKAIIFAAIPSLIAFVLSGRELYDSFLPDEHLFAGKVLANQFKDLHIFEDAALALQARSHPQDLWIPERMESLFSNHEARLAIFSPFESFPRHWNGQTFIAKSKISLKVRIPGKKHRHRMGADSL